MEDGVLYTADVTFNTPITVVYDTPVTAPYAYVDNGAGGTVLAYAPVDYVQTEIISTKPDYGSIPNAPILDMSRSIGQWESYQPVAYETIYSIIQAIRVSWLPVEGADYYQVFLLFTPFDAPSSNAVDFGTQEDAVPVIQYTQGDLFNLDSGPLYKFDFDITFNTYMTGGSENYRVINAFVFAYNDYGRSKFPITMMSFVAYGPFKESPRYNTVFIENTSYRYPETERGKSINFVDGSSNIGGAAQNLSSKAMTKYVPPLPEPNAT
jgi:hypothetical protein